MEFIAAIPLIGGLLSTLLPTLVVLGIVVFIHEYGHYIVGRWCGIHAEVFSIGFGKSLTQWQDKRGTIWQVALIPLGGFVKFKGDLNAASFDDGTPRQLDADAFPSATVGRRALTVLALIMWNGQAADDPVVGALNIELEAHHDLAPGDEILAVAGQPVATYSEIARTVRAMDGAGDIPLTVLRDGTEREVLAPYLFPPMVEFVTPLSAASKAGLKPQDLITRIDGQDVNSFSQLKTIVLASQDKELIIDVRRQGEILQLPITPELVEALGPDGEVQTQVLIGVAGAVGILPTTETVPVWQALPAGFVRVWDVIVLSLTGLKHMITGALGTENLNGPLGIAMVSGETATQGWLSFISLIALISTAIGLLNLFPIPVLDGGHLVVYAYEAIVGRQPHPRILNMAMSVGFMLLLALMLFATYNDIMRI